MIILTAINTTPELEDAKGMANYDVQVAINAQPPIWRGTVIHHRSDGAAALLSRIAAAMRNGSSVDYRPPRAKRLRHN